MLLEVEGLDVRFDTADGEVAAVSDLGFRIDRGETLAIVGESGSGKSQTAFAILGLLARNGRATGSVRLGGREILGLPDAEMNRIRANDVAMIFQDPMTSLNPYMKVSTQMIEVLALHKGLSRRAARREAVAMLDAVRIPDGAARIDQYPHEFSGGMRQRIMIAIALLCRPKLLIADEPTTALDVTVQAQIMHLLAEIQEEMGMATILITHDLGIVAGTCARTLVLYGGRIMEEGATEAIFEAPSHPYTAGLMAAVPRLDREDATLATIPGEPPDMMNAPAGCPFAPRCAAVMAHCHAVRPELRREGDRRRACHLERRAVA